MVWDDETKVKFESATCCHICKKELSGEFRGELIKNATCGIRLMRSINCFSQPSRIRYPLDFPEKLNLDIVEPT